ncbi:hypothetical protein EZV62_026553 [Acer yangbiense]|uniref:Non-specific serine/threonine protein kinase n=1 Tax=Acer yangbiense TaxID=1000413 RepID=A0A5C7GRW2_9ROSI|nr:hypothetical protein EZV62_026553 [Acer yangbiense]
MEPGNSGVSVALIVLLFFVCLDFGAAVDTITASRSIRDPESIISSDNAYKLGFFSPGNSSNRYVGIWYNDASEAVIWVANRNKPLNGASGVVNISDDGRLVVLNEQREVLWSSNVSNSVANVRAQLLDSGNLVLYDNSDRSIWESFDEPTNTFLRRMKLTTNVRTGENVMLTSWKSPSDPSIGSFSAGLNLLNIPQVFTWNNNIPFWRSGQWNGREFIGITNVTSVYLGGFELVENKAEGTASLSFEFAIDSTTYFVLDTEGRLLQNNRVDGKEWQIRQTYPENVCDVYGKCGEFGICSPRSEPICSCLRGFEPKNIEEWSRGNWTSGCVRRTPLQCESKNKTGDAGKEDGFLKFGMVKVPDFAERTTALEDRCRELCLSNCSCIAYAYDAGIGCMSWRDNLTDVQQFYSKGTDFYIRVAHSELDKKDMKVVIIVPVVVGAVVIAISAFFLWRWMAKRKDFGAAIDTFTASRSIKDPETIISSGSAFKLGFFGPGNSLNRYVGILYNDASEAVVWVANRNKPLNDAHGVVTISERTSAPKDRCRVLCLSNCSCIAYAYDSAIGCMSWRDNLTDVQQFCSKGTDFYIRVAHSELDKQDMKVVIIVPVVVATKEKSSLLQREEGSRNFSGENKSKDKLQELSLFDFEKLATATKDFHLINKLGEGGFGPVHRVIYGCSLNLCSY